MVGGTLADKAVVLITGGILRAGDKPTRVLAHGRGRVG